MDILDNEVGSMEENYIRQMGGIVSSNEGFSENETELMLIPPDNKTRHFKTANGDNGNNVVLRMDDLIRDDDSEGSEYSESQSVDICAIIDEYL